MAVTMTNKRLITNASLHKSVAVIMTDIVWSSTASLSLYVCLSLSVSDHCPYVSLCVSLSLCVCVSVSCLSLSVV